MPPRFITFCIIVFWLTTMVWMFYREVWPWLDAKAPPPFYTDLTDEVSGRVIFWEVFEGGKKVGRAKTHINRRANRQYVLRNELLFSQFQILGLNVAKISDRYRVTWKGELVDFSATISLETGVPLSEIEVSGKVENGILTPRLTISRLPEFDNIELSSVDLTDRSVILNVMHPQHKIPGLFEGRSWKVPIFNPMEFSALPMLKSFELPSLLAKVRRDTIEWNGESVRCWRIDVIKPGDENKPTAEIWVRASDDLVLQHRATYKNKRLVLKRVPDRRNTKTEGPREPGTLLSGRRSNVSPFLRTWEGIGS